MQIWPRLPLAGVKVTEIGTCDRREISLLSIEIALPHRGDALFPSSCWLDSVSAGRVSGGGMAAWSANHPVLRGHFPGLAIVPGIFLIEAVAQIAGVLVSVSQEVESTGHRIGVLSSVKKTDRKSVV